MMGTAGTVIKTPATAREQDSPGEQGDQLEPATLGWSA